MKKKTTDKLKEMFKIDETFELDKKQKRERERERRINYRADTHTHNDSFHR